MVNPAPQWVGRLLKVSSKCGLETIPFLKSAGRELSNEPHIDHHYGPKKFRKIFHFIVKFTNLQNFQNKLCYFVWQRLIGDLG